MDSPFGSAPDSEYGYYGNISAEEYGWANVDSCPPEPTLYKDVQLDMGFQGVWTIDSDV